MVSFPAVDLPPDNRVQITSAKRRRDFFLSASKSGVIPSRFQPIQPSGSSNTLGLKVQL
jgi:hypothetical protein